MRATILAIALVLSILRQGWCFYQRVDDNADFQLDPKVENALFRELRRECPNCPESGNGDEKSRKKIFDKVDETKAGVPFSQERLEKMMHKAIIKIITGDLSYADVLLLKSLNYSLEQVLAIRLMELRKGKKPLSPLPATQPPMPEKRKPSGGRFLDYEDFNKKAINDYEEMASELQQQSSEEKREHRNFDKAMESHVVFKIRYDDSEFDSSDSEDRSDENVLTSGTRDPRGSSSFQAPNGDVAVTLPPAATTPSSTVNPRLNSSEENSTAGKSEYEGLEWVEDDVYRVIPEALNYDNDNDNWNNDGAGNGSSSGSSGSGSGSGSGSSSSSGSGSNGYGLDYDENRSNVSENDTTDFQNDSPDSVQLFMANANNSDNYSSANLSSHGQRNWAHRQDGSTSPFGSQGQKAIEDIKLRVLAMTGRFNLTSNISQIHRERLKMFSPTCQLPRNTDTEAWTDPFFMNMHFQLNLTSGEHVVTAKLRLYKLPQENVAISGSSTAGIEEDEEEGEEDEKKIRISVYFYTKSLKKHRAKKRLMDSVVTPLTTTGSRLALDVRQALRYWRSNSPRNTGNHNHGLVVEVEDQDGKSLKPALYIHPPSCQPGSSASSVEHDQDEKTSTSRQYSSEPVLVTYAS